MLKIFFIIINISTNINVFNAISNNYYFKLSLILNWLTNLNKALIHLFKFTFVLWDSIIFFHTSAEY